jgi:SpoVK/Ycf46/Vps4 family AAA+-type ATPase
VLPSDTLEQLHELEAWIRHEQVLMGDWGLARRLRPGYRCLLYGPPGTGKTLAATLLGKRVGRDVYRVALSTVVSKYIGETEKNLERIFTRAESMSCILFFDEADALFGKRTNVSDAHDRYANQEVAYLLQRIEDFPGVVILASNYSSNIDDAFTRRFQAVVHFPLPEAAERERLWAASFSEESVLAADVAFDEIALQYELSGGAMMNVVRYASLMALEAGDNVVRNHDIIDGIRRELNKDGRTF